MMKINNLPVLICLVIISLFANQAYAAEWIFLGAVPTGDQYYNKKSIEEVNKNIFHVLIKERYNDNGKMSKFSFLKKTGNAPNNPYVLSHELRLLEINCANKKIKVSSDSIYDKQGHVIASMPRSYVKRSDIFPDSIAKTLNNTVCSAGQPSPKKKK